MAKSKMTSTPLDHGSNDNRKVSVKTVARGPAVRVEFPVEGAEIDRPSFTFQITAEAGTDGVEVSIDNGDFLPCREALGLWWYDWSGFDAGDHEVVARACRMGAILMSTSAARRFTVK